VSINLALVFFIWRHSLHRLRSYCWENTVSRLQRIFPCSL